MFGTVLEFLSQLFKAPSPAPAQPSAATAEAAPSSTAAAGGPPPIEVAQFQQMIGRVSELTSTVVQDVGHHNKNIKAISSELTAVAQSDPNAVAAIVCKLLVANQELQGRLERAEATLQTHSRQLHDAVTTARTDALTNLLNRRALDEKLSACVNDFERHGQPSTVLILDVDHFKQFNDTFGHLIGDKGLIHVAGTLRKQAQSMDLVARFGGEEFVMVFCGQTISDIRERAECIRRAIGKQAMTIEGCERKITASGGLAELTAGDCVADWMKRADSALYSAKNGGRDCLFEQNKVGAERVTVAVSEEKIVPLAPGAPQRTVVECAAELAAEAFADTSFVPNVARRIAEWRRGGTTLSVVLARLDGDFGSEDSAENALHAPMRKAMSAARASVREMDVVTRWQSDGIAMLLPNTAAADTKAIIRRLKTLMATDASEQQVPLSLCIGVSEGIEGNDAKRVLERAWLALEAARATGAGGVAVHDGLKCVGMKFAPLSR